MFRSSFHWALIVGLLFTAGGRLGRAAGDEWTVLPKKIDGRAPAAMMPDYLQAKVRESLARRKATVAALTTPERIREHQRRTKAFFLEQLGGLPERTPLNARTVGRLERDGYRIEKVIYENQPGLFVTALLYLPEAKPPYPGVLVPCGHSGTGKAGETYQRASILAARAGMAALCYDPIEQGERSQLLDRHGKPKAGCLEGHNRIGVGSILLGRNTATFRVWDGIRGLDYLASRPDIDATRLGCLGNSGGGTLTAYLMALDDRIQCAASSCYVTGFGRLLDTIGPQDAEQNIHGQLAFGMDHADYLLMRAPRPTLLCAARDDFFDIRGTRDVFREAKEIFTRLGFADQVNMVEADGKHGFSSPLRVGAVGWMRRWLLNANNALTEPDAAILTDKEAQCTPRGRVDLLDGARTTYDLNAQYESRLAEKRRALWNGDRDNALDAVRRVSGVRPLDKLPVPKVERVGRMDREGCTVEKLIFRPEPGIRLPALLVTPKTSPTGACLVLDERGAGAPARAGELEAIARRGEIVLAVDLRGIGETSHKPAQRPDYAAYLGSEWADFTEAYLLGTSYLAMRTEDAMVCARWLAENQPGGGPTKPVRVVASGVLGPPALHAAALASGSIARLTLRGSINSWSAVVRDPWAKRQYVNVVHGALAVYDLPDLIASLPKDRVEQLDPRRPDGKPLLTKPRREGE